MKLLSGGFSTPEKVKTYLIGQIDKNFSIQNNCINLKGIFDCIWSIIHSAIDLVGGRTVILECNDDPKIISLYEAQGFKVLIRVTAADELTTMYIVVKS